MLIKSINCFVYIYGPMFGNTIMRRSTRSNVALQSPRRPMKRKSSATTQASPDIKLDDESSTVRKGSSSNDAARKRVKREPSAEPNQTSESVASSPQSPPSQSDPRQPNTTKPHQQKPTLSETKWRSWSRDAYTSPFPDFPRPTEQECHQSHCILESLHGDTVRKNFEYTENPSMHYPYVMDALVVATLNQATS